MLSQTNGFSNTATTALIQHDLEMSTGENSPPRAKDYEPSQNATGSRWSARQQQQLDASGFPPAKPSPLRGDVGSPNAVLGSPNAVLPGSAHPISPTGRVLDLEAFSTRDSDRGS